METAEVTTAALGAEVPVLAPVQRFVVDIDQAADGASASRIVEPARLLRLGSLLQATLSELDDTPVRPEQVAVLQRQFELIRHDLGQAISPPLAAELQRILPPDQEPTADALRIEYAALASWVDGLVMQMLTVFTAASDWAQQRA